MDDLRTDINGGWMPPVAPNAMPVQALDRPYRDEAAPEVLARSRRASVWRAATFLPAIFATGAIIAAFTDWFAMDGFNGFEGAVIGLIAFTFFWIALSFSTALWTDREGNYWGHNAIMRTAAFASCAGLPKVRGVRATCNTLGLSDHAASTPSHASILSAGRWAISCRPLGLRSCWSGHLWGTATIRTRLRISLALIRRSAGQR